VARDGLNHPLDVSLLVRRGAEVFPTTVHLLQEASLACAMSVEFTFFLSFLVWCEQAHSASEPAFGGWSKLAWNSRSMPTSDEQPLFLLGVRLTCDLQAPTFFASVISRRVALLL
jgi:hypothetical protein